MNILTPDERRTKLAIYGPSQSNGVGLLTAANQVVYPANLTQAFPAVLWQDHVAYAIGDPPVYHDEGPRSLSPRSSGSGSYTAGMGTSALTALRELTFRTRWRWRGGQFAVDGSGLEDNWLANWPSNGPPYAMAQFIAYVQGLMATYGIAHSSDVVFLIHNGEHDSGQSPDAADMLNNMLSLASILTAAFPGCYFVVGRLHSGFSNNATVRAAHEAFVALTPRAGILYIDHLPLRDGTHLTDDGFASRGVLEANTVIKLMTNVPPTNPWYVAASAPVVGTSAQGVTILMPPHQTNDVIVSVLSALGNVNYPFNPANNFVEVSGSPQHDSSSTLNARLHVGQVRATSNNMPAMTFQDVSGDDAKIGLGICFRGCRTTGNPIEASAGAVAASSTNVTFPAVTTLTDNALVVNILAARIDSNSRQASGFVNPDLTDLTEHVNQYTNASLGYGITVCVGRKKTHGAVRGTTCTLATAGTQAMLTLVLAP